MEESGLMSWIDWFLSQPQNQYFVKVDMTYISDLFNSYGLRQKIPRFKEALLMIKGPYVETDDEDLVDQACKLYGLIHARFIITIRGLEKMKVKYSQNTFQPCPRFLCSGTECLPYGCSEVPDECSMKLYCPNCGDVYEPNTSFFKNIDGAYFGPSWVHIYLQHYSHLIPKNPPVQFVPRVFGFKLSEKKALKKKEEDNKEEEK